MPLTGGMKLSCLHLHIIVERLPCDANVPDPELRRWRIVAGLTFTVTLMTALKFRRQSHVAIPCSSELIAHCCASSAGLRRCSSGKIQCKIKSPVVEGYSSAYCADFAIAILFVWAKLLLISRSVATIYYVPLACVYPLSLLECTRLCQRTMRAILS